MIPGSTVNREVMITFEKALQIIESSVSPLPVESVPFTKALNRILAGEVFSDTDIPAFDKAAMDGFACRKSDLGNELEMVEEIQAGRIPAIGIGTNQCTRIMTGAMVPEGADFILMKEHADVTASGKIRCTMENAVDNICRKGEDIRSGDVILSPGTRIQPAHLAMLASAGCISPFVYKIPGVAVISTGNELVGPDQRPAPGKIRDSNGYQLSAQISQTGISSDYLGIIRDEESELSNVLKAAFEKYELVLISGGVSVGDYDYVPETLRKLNMEILFHGMNVKPGKRLLFGKKNGHYAVGMPGNPVSALVLFEVLVKPLLNRLMGSTERPLRLHLPLGQAYSRKTKEALFFIPVDLTETGVVLPLEYHGSAHIHAYTRAKGIMEVPAGLNYIKEGALVHVRPL